MEVFGNNRKMRGCFNKFTIIAGGSGAVLNFGGGDNFVVTGIAAAQHDTLYNHKCFNDVTHVYAFGHDPDRSSVTVSAVGMLVTPAAKPSGVITAQMKAYETGRAYTKGSVVAVAMGKDVLTGFLVGVSTSTRSEEYQLQDFQFTLSVPRAYGSVSGSAGGGDGRPRLAGGQFGSPREGTTLGGGPFSGGRR